MSTWERDLAVCEEFLRRRPFHQRTLVAKLGLLALLGRMQQWEATAVAWLRHLIGRGLHREAETVARAALALCPRSLDLRLALLECRLAQGEVAADLALEIAELLHEQGDLPRCARFLEAAWSAAPQAVALGRLLGAVYLAQGEALKAEGAYRRLLKSDPHGSLQTLHRLELVRPGDRELLLEIGSACRKAGRLSEASEAFRQVLRHRLDDSDALQGLLLVCRERGEHAMAALVESRLCTI